MKLRNIFKGPKGDPGQCGPMGPMGMRGKDADPYAVAMILAKDPAFVRTVARAVRKEKEHAESKE